MNIRGFSVDMSAVNGKNVFFMILGAALLYVANALFDVQNIIANIALKDYETNYASTIIASTFVGSVIFSEAQRVYEDARQRSNGDDEKELLVFVVALSMTCIAVIGSFMGIAFTLPDFLFLVIILVIVVQFFVITAIAVSRWYVITSQE